MREHRYWVYILVSRSLSAMYIGVTNVLGRRVAEHRAGKGSEFVRKYKVTRLVYAEEFEQIEEARMHNERSDRSHPNNVAWS